MRVRSMLRTAVRGSVRGGIVTLVVGAAIGFALRSFAAFFTYSWVDLPLCGGIFGFVVGGIGGMLTGAIVGATSPHSGSRIVGVIGAVAGATFCGAWIGAAIFPFDDRATIFALLGSLGGIIGGSAPLIALRTRSRPGPQV